MTQINDFIDINESPRKKKQRFANDCVSYERTSLNARCISRTLWFYERLFIKNREWHESPPIGTLARIARSMGVDLSVFFVDENTPGNPLFLDADSPISVVHSWERKPVSRGGTEYGYDYVSLAHKKSNRSMDPFIFTYPQTTETHEFFEHTGEEFIYLLTGKVEFEFKVHGQLTRFILEAGDSVYFESSTPHRGRALEGEAQAIVVITETEE